MNPSTHRLYSLLVIVGLAISFLVSFGSLLDGQTGRPVTYDVILKMVDAGLAESTILTVIQSSPGNFDVSVPALIT